MALRGKKPTEIKKRFKAVLYGDSGVGKSTAAIKFPKPYIIDTEGGIENDEYVEIMKQNGAEVFSSTDFDEILKEVTELLSLKHDFKTLVIDSMTVLYSSLYTHYAAKFARISREPDSEGTEFQRHKDRADMEIKKLLNLMSRLDMNVIIIAHSKSKWKGGKEDGTTFDSYKKTDYLSDLVVEVQKQGKKRIGFVKKTRIKGFAEDSTFDFSYDEICNKYGRDAIEKESAPEELSTPEQLQELDRLIKLLHVQQDVVDKWLNKAKANTLSDMSKDKTQAVIDSLLTKIKQPTPEE
jgi:RecA-family ATPase